MKDIHFVDLQGLHSCLQPQLAEAMQKVVQSGCFINGPAIEEFESTFAKVCGVNHVIACANGTDALQLILMALGLRPDDEVIVPDFTYAATVEAALLLGLRPVLVPVDQATFNIDVEAVEAAITSKTKAIVPVHLYGQCADMQPILALSQQHGLAVIEDAAQAVGAEYSFGNGPKAIAGTMGAAGAISFFPSKNLGCMGDGGAVMTNDSELAEKLKMLASHGQLSKYRHRLVGINSRLDTLQAAVLNVKLPHLPDITSRRQAAADRYDSLLAGCDLVQVPARSPFSSHVFHQYTVKVSDGRRHGLQKFLAKKSIPTQVYYPLPLHRQEAYREVCTLADGLDSTEKLCGQVLSLPMHTELSSDQIEYIAHQIKSY